MTVVTVDFLSAALWRYVSYTVLLPDPQVVGPGPYPVLYQLHGGNQRHTAWLHFSRLAHYVGDLPFIVVMPDGPQSRWANGGVPFAHYEDFLMDDLAEHVVNSFHASKGKWAIGGNSMGGFGAVRLGLKYPDRFSSIWSHSGVFPRADGLPEHWYWTGSAADLNCYALIEQLDLQTMPRLSFDCGTEDHLLESNRRFHQFLEARGVPHTYAEHSGSHDWDYWDRQVPAALKQHIAVFENCDVNR